MRIRTISAVGVAALLVTGAIALKFGAPSMAGQTASTNGAEKPAAPAGPAPKTAWGEPDLQGIWTPEFDTPLQRPAKYGNRQTFTDEERAVFDKETARILGAEKREYSKGTEADVSGAYNAGIFTTHLRTGPRTSLIIDPPNGRIPSFTDDMKKRQAEFHEYQLALLSATVSCRDKKPACAGGQYGPPSKRRNEPPPQYVTSGAQGGGAAGAGGGAINRSDGPEDRNLGERCLSFSIPDFGGYKRIVQGPGQVAIFYDAFQGQGGQRVIPITSRPHLPANIRERLGDSRAHWEGDTLVVDVTNFWEKRDYNGSHEQMHLVERWRRVSADTLEYTALIEDPSVWTSPWTVKQEFKKQDDKANKIFYEPRCHEGNYGLIGLLLGERAAEREFKQGKAPDPATRCSAGCGGFALGFADEGEDSNPLNR